MLISRPAVRRSCLAALCALFVAVAPSAAVAAKPEKYKFTATSTSFSYIKSVCQARGGEYIVTETILQEITDNRSGSGEVGTRRNPGKGGQRGYGRVRYTYSKTVQGPDPAPPEDWTSEYQTGGGAADWSPFTHTGAGLRVDLNIQGAEFYSLAPPAKVGKSKTFSLDQPEETTQSEDENCTYEERTSRTGSLTVTRVR